MWQGATWKRVGMADVMDPSVVKKLYYKAVMLVHPDKQANAGPDQEYIANRVFGALNEAWKGPPGLKSAKHVRAIVGRMLIG